MYTIGKWTSQLPWLPSTDIPTLSWHSYCTPYLPPKPFAASVCDSCLESCSWWSQPRALCIFSCSVHMYTLGKCYAWLQKDLNATVNSYKSVFTFCTFAHNYSHCAFTMHCKLLFLHLRTIMHSTTVLQIQNVNFLLTASYCARNGEHSKQYHGLYHI